jgi:hypothetical protein
MAPSTRSIGRALLGAAREVEAAQNRRRASSLGPGPKAACHEVGEGLLDGRELEGELEDLLLRVLELRSVAKRRTTLAGGAALDDAVELGLEDLARLLFVRVESLKRRAPIALRTFALLQVAEELDETRDEVGLGEEHVHGHAHLQRLLQLVDALADLCAAPSARPAPPCESSSSEPR